MYINNFFNYKRRTTHSVNVGDVIIGGDAPIVLQTMTSTATNDIDGTVEQIIKCVDAGAEIVRITVPGMKDLEYLKEVKEKLKSRSCFVPLVADTHYNQKIALEAAKVVNKVRINPGNFVDTKKFKVHNYTDDEYNSQLEKVREIFLPLLDICREYKTALRIGSNHGSLSDRIMSRYGDTPEGMAESAMEFLRFCKEEDFRDVVVSMKSSNTLVMVQAVRLLTDMMVKEEMTFPLHLGVTEAGEGEDGRIKSALGIGALLADGIGDTIRVSLTEHPAEEVPVAEKLVNAFKLYKKQTNLPEITYPVNPFSFNRRKSLSVDNVGDGRVPVVIANNNQGTKFPNQEPEYLFVSDIKKAIDPKKLYVVAIDAETKIDALSQNIIPLLRPEQLDKIDGLRPVFVEVDVSAVDDAFVQKIKDKNKIGLILKPSGENYTAELRWGIIKLMNEGIQFPIIVKAHYQINNLEDLQITAAAQLGVLFLDGLCDGIWLDAPDNLNEDDVSFISFGILQASRMRFTKTEYISCPSCGRTLYNIQETTRKIRNRTSHLKGLKIGVMGCIVNGLGEMADADYGYIGGAPGKVNLYHQKELIKRGVLEDLAVDELINLIKDKGDWVEPK